MQATETYELRKDINEIHSHLQLPHRDIGEAPVFGDPFAEYDADIVAWSAAHESGAAAEEEEEEEEQPRHRTRCSTDPRGKAPTTKEEEEIQEEEEIEDE